MQLVRLLESRETNHIEFCKIKSVLDDVLHLYSNSELNKILKLLMDPTWVATGLKVEQEMLVSNFLIINLFSLLFIIHPLTIEIGNNLCRHR